MAFHLCILFPSGWKFVLSFEALLDAHNIGEKIGGIRAGTKEFALATL